MWGIGKKPETRSGKGDTGTQRKIEQMNLQREGKTKATLHRGDK